MVSPQRTVMSFLGYNKIQDGGRPPFWKTENHNNSAAIWDIITKFGVVIDVTVRNLPWHHFWPVTKSNMATGRHFAKRKIAITQPLFEISSPNLVCWWPGQPATFIMSLLAYNKIQDGGRPPFWKKRKIAITRPPFEISSPNLAWWKTCTVRNYVS